MRAGSYNSVLFACVSRTRVSGRMRPRIIIRPLFELDLLRATSGAVESPDIHIIIPCTSSPRRRFLLRVQTRTYGCTRFSQAVCTNSGNIARATRVRCKLSAKPNSSTRLNRIKSRNDTNVNRID